MKCKLILACASFAAFLLVPSPSLRADVLDHWTTNQISTNFFGLRNVVYGNGLYIAAGEESDSGGIYSSQDGLHWTLRYSDPNAWGLTLAYAGGRFVSVCPWAFVNISTNGTNWSESSLPYGYNDEFGHVGDITYGNGSYVEVGDVHGVGNILTSSNGVTWTSPYISPSPSGHISSVVCGADTFVAIGNNDGIVYIAFIDDIDSWFTSSIPGGNIISYCSGLYIVPFGPGTNLLSTEGWDWATVKTGITNQLGGVIYTKGLFMARAGNFLATSVDGTNWVQYPQMLQGNDLATDGSRLVTIDRVLSGEPLLYNSFVYTSDFLVDVRMTNGPAVNVALSGLVGRSYQIQSADVLMTDANNWKTNTTLQLPSTPYVWTDSTATNSQRFYRGVLLP